MSLSRRRRTFVTQPPVDWIETSLTMLAIETVETDLSEGQPAELYMIIVEQTNNGATAEDIMVNITINGTVVQWDLSGIASGTPQYLQIDKNLSGTTFNPTHGTSARGVLLGTVSSSDILPFVAESVSEITVQQTSTVDAVAAQIEVNIIWAKAEVVP